MAGSWNIKEVEAIVKDYFDMLSHELGGEKYNKSAHRRGLTTRLNGRSEGSIERKYQNISAILIELGMPYISGYKPLKNYQRTVLPDAILDFLAAVPTLRARISEDVEAVPKVPPLEDILNVMVAPPKGRIKKKHGAIRQRSSIREGPWII